MINKINVNNLNNKQQQYPKNEPNFGDGGIGQFILTGLQLCEAQPMVNVAVADLSTAIIPRTIIEGQTNVYGGFEALRRESSGLIINCMIPSFIVLGIAKLIQNRTMAEGTKMADCWANEDTINLVTDHWKKASDKEVKKGAEVIYKEGSKEAKIYHTIKDILTNTTGIDGDKEVQFEKFIDSNFDENIHKLTQETLKPKNKPWYFSKEARDGRKAVRAARKAAELAKEEYVGSDAISQIIHKTRVNKKIKIKGHGTDYFSQSASDILENSPKLLRELASGKIPETKTFADKAKKLLKYKSLGGLAVILPLAIAAQPINRWLTERSSGKKGAPIYKDFENSQRKELNSSEKAALLKQKFISVGSMIGVALLSIGKLPSLAMAKNISQFKSIFPSLDQARLISTATFSSRMMASEDRNDLREATYRDIATFSTFYFINDYFEKAVATLIQKAKKGTDKEVILLNELSKKEKGANSLWHWIKNTSLKSTAEMYGKTAEATKHAKNMRSVCQLANLGFQLVFLGIIIPNVYRKKTEKEHEKELKLMEMNKKTAKTDKAA